MKNIIHNGRSLFVGAVLAAAIICAGCGGTNVHALRVRAPIAKRDDLSGRVVIDAGHGGKDGGSVGKRGLKEKDVTLDIARRLKRIIEQLLPNVEVALTRHNDSYVSLEDRIRIASRRPGDLFLSLHVNANESKEASGFEIYSLDVASDRHAERLAARENKVPGKNGKGVNFILADLRAFSNRKDSDRLAKSVASGLNSQLAKTQFKSAANDRGYNQAIFQVLFVKMPAVLAELFFISNPKEEKMLSDKAAREVIARGLFIGVRNFLVENKSRVQRGNQPRS